MYRYSTLGMKREREFFFDAPQSIEEAAAALKLSYAFVYDEIQRGRLRARKFSRGAIRLLPADLQDWLDRSATTEEVKP